MPSPLQSSFVFCATEMFFSAFTWVITIILFFGVPSENFYSTKKAPSASCSTSSSAFGILVVDAFQFQSPTIKCNRRVHSPTASSSSLLRQAPEKSFAAESSSAIREQKSATRTNAPPAKDREEDLKFTIEIIMQFIESSDSNSDSNSMNDINSNQDSSADLAKDQEETAGSLPVDYKMNSKYEELALMVKDEVEKQQLKVKTDDPNNEHETTTTTWWCAIAGGPGSGKSTLAKRVSEICHERFGISSIVVPMDGYLFSRSDLSEKLELDERGCLDYLRRRGSPHTVDAEQLCQDLMAASGRQPTLQNGFYNMYVGDGGMDNPSTESVPPKPAPFAFPDYRRTAPSDPVSKQIKFDPSLHKLVFVEGEYILLGKGGMVPGYVTETESKRWKPLLDVFDATWFVTCQQEQDETAQDENAAAEAQGWYNYDFQEQRKRRIQHHLQHDEDDEETLQALFPSFQGKALSREDVASKRLESNDVLNMLIAETSKQHASLIIRSV